MTVNSLTPKRLEQGWVIEMTPEMAYAAGVAEGSYVVLYISEGNVTAEMLPPATQEMKQSVQRSIDKFGDAFAEMERLGD